MKISRFWLLVTFVPILAVAIIGGCIWLVAPRTHTIVQGSHGLLSIGQSKSEVRAILEANGLWPIRPVIADAIDLYNPDVETLTEEFENEAGVMIWLGRSLTPLRLEFRSDRLLRTWPGYGFVNSIQDIEERNREYRRLRSVLPPGTTRDEAFEIIASFDTHSDRTVSTFVTGAQRYYELGLNSAMPEEFEALGSSRVGWRFSGMKDAVWYSGFLSPFYSTVTLHFNDDRLSRIDHYQGAFEIP